MRYLLILLAFVLAGCVPSHEVRTHTWNDFTARVTIRPMAEIKIFCENLTGKRDRIGCAAWDKDRKHVDVFIPPKGSMWARQWHELIGHEIDHGHSGYFHD